MCEYYYFTAEQVLRLASSSAGKAAMDRFRQQLATMPRVPEGKFAPGGVIGPTIPKASDL